MAGKKRVSMKGKIAWLVPYPIKGSGGHRTIFSHVQHLIARGYDCHVYIGAGHAGQMDGDELRGRVEQCFGPCSAHFHGGYDVHQKVDMAVATIWWTAKEVALRVQADHKLYFVQDFEPWFYPMGDAFIAAEDSYNLQLTPVTIGRWLSHCLHERYGSPRSFFEFTADSAVYHPISACKKEFAVCYIYQPEKPRRCSAIGRETLATVKYHCPDVAIYTFGSNELPNFDFEHTHLGILTLEECNQLYNRCMVGLCLSGSNPSRVPFEMMAAGLPAVDFYGENTIYDLPQQGVLLAEKNPSALAGAIVELLNNPLRQKEMSRFGVTFMQDRPAELEFEQFGLVVDSMLAGYPVVGGEHAPLYQAGPFAKKLSNPLYHNKRFSGAATQKSGMVEKILHHLRNNRIERILKVLWRGYY